MTLSRVGTAAHYGVSATSITQAHTLAGLANGLTGVLVATQCRNATVALTAGQVTINGVALTDVGTTINHQTGRYLRFWWLPPASHPGAGSFNVAVSAQTSADRQAFFIQEVQGSSGAPYISHAPAGVIGASGTANTADLALTATASDLTFGVAQRGAAPGGSYTPDGSPALTEIFDATPGTSAAWMVGFLAGGTNADVTATAGGGNIGIQGVVISETAGGFTGDSNQTLDNVTGAATGSLSLTADSAATLENVTGSATGSLAVQGQSAATLENVTGAGAGSLALQAQSAATLEDVGGASTASLALEGQSAGALEDVTGAATGVYGSDLVGESNATLEDVTGAATGLIDDTHTAVSAVTLQDVMGAGEGLLFLQGSSDGLLDNVTGVAAGIFGVPPIRRKAYATLLMRPLPVGRLTIRSRPVGILRRL